MPVSSVMRDKFGLANPRQRKEIAVSIEEIVHTCSNEKVAHAAVASLGFDFASRVRSEAESHGIAMGSFVANIIRDFGEAADAGERKAVYRAMDRTDQPILCGLRFILEGRLRMVQGTSSAQWRVGTFACPMPDMEARHAR